MQRGVDRVGFCLGPLLETADRDVALPITFYAWGHPTSAPAMRKLVRSESRGHTVRLAARRLLDDVLW